MKENIKKHNPPLKAKCTRAYGVDIFLTKGNTYEVTETYVDCGVMYYLIPTVHATEAFLADRFYVVGGVVEESTAVCVVGTPGPGAVSKESQPLIVEQTYDSDFFETYNSLRGLPGRR